MEFVTDAADACRRALGRELVPIEVDQLPAAAAWAAAEFLDADAAPDRKLATLDPAGATELPWPGPIVVAEHAAESQFVRLQERLAAGARGAGGVPDPLACVAVSGARFRGQRGRSWATLRGNLHVSVHLRLDAAAREVQAALAVLPAVAACRAIERASGGEVRPGLKWVNDLLLDGGKVGGVLSSSHVEAGRVRHLVLGIGLNVAALPELPPSPRALAAVRLADVAPSFDDPHAWGRLLEPLLEEIVASRDALAEGRSATIVEAYRARAAFLGRDVTIWPVDASDDADARPVARGRVEALLPDLSLKIAGRDEPVRQGRMTLDTGERPELP